MAEGSYRVLYYAAYDFFQGGDYVEEPHHLFDAAIIRLQPAPEWGGTTGSIPTQPPSLNANGGYTCKNE